MAALKYMTTCATVRPASPSGAVPSGEVNSISNMTAAIWLTVFDLAEPAGGDDPARTGRDEPEAADGELAREHDDAHPRRHAPLSDQHDQRGHHQQLVRDRVDELAEVGHEVAPARDLAVEEVGGRGDAEHGERRVLLPTAFPSAPAPRTPAPCRSLRAKSYWADSQSLLLFGGAAPKPPLKGLSP